MRRISALAKTPGHHRFLSPSCFIINTQAPGRFFSQGSRYAIGPCVFFVVNKRGKKLVSRVRRQAMNTSAYTSHTQFRLNSQQARGGSPDKGDRFVDDQFGGLHSLNLWALTLTLGPDRSTEWVIRLVCAMGLTVENVGFGQKKISL